ncbi:MAG: hypothetical protein IJX48_06385 [Paludibacteraceae bacterium]|nr:hypothetical protein [Paludibacteraceae bacterium]
MLSLRTIEPHTLELLKALMQEPALCELRLVGGTALALLMLRMFIEDAWEDMKLYISNQVKLYNQQNN